MRGRITRRQFLATGALAGAARLHGFTLERPFAPGAADLWSEVPAILSRIATPSFPSRVVNVATYGAKGDGTTDCTQGDVTVGEVAEAIVAADFFYEEGRNGGFVPVLRDVDVRHVTSRKSKYVFLLRGFKESPITDVRVSDCVFDGVASPDVLEGVRDLVLQNVTINGTRHDERISRWQLVVTCDPHADDEEIAEILSLCVLGELCVRTSVIRRPAPRIRTPRTRAAVARRRPSRPLAA